MTDIAKEYGAALFLLACDADAKKEFAEALDIVKDVFDENPGYMEFLSSPGIPLGERLSALESAFSEKLPEYVLSFLQLLCEKGRISAFYDAAEEYATLFDASQRISNAKITSAVPLTEDEKRKLEAKLEKQCGGRVKSEYFVDEALIGGLVVEIDGRIMDGSVRQRLREVKEVIGR